jgi:predicted lipid-binding transport protein (Tim44 family)
MKNWLSALAITVAATSIMPTVVEAKRLGKGMSSGMQRSQPARPATPPPAQPAAPQATPATPATAATAGAAGTAAAAAAAPKRSWMGPIAGLAAGLGIAALLSHLGLGAGLANLLTMALFGIAAFFLIRFLMRRFAGGSQRPTLAAAGGAPWTPNMSSPQDQRTTAFSPVPASAPTAAVSTLPPLSPVMSPGMSPSSPAAAAPAVALPADFDRPAFERIAKMIFIRMQAANDSGDLNDLRQFTTPELYASIRLDLQERGSSPNVTDVVNVDADVLELESTAEHELVSVRFHGLIREAVGAEAEAFDEVWHLVRPADGSRQWAIAGIQQVA